MSILTYKYNKIHGIEPPRAKTFDEMTVEEQDEFLRQREIELLRRADELDRQADAAAQRLDTFYGNMAL